MIRAAQECFNVAFRYPEVASECPEVASEVFSDSPGTSRP